MNKQKNQMIYDTLLNCVRQEKNSNQTDFTNEQWLGLLNGYVRKEDVSHVAEKLALRPLTVNYWYCHFSIAISENALRLR